MGTQFQAGAKAVIIAVYIAVFLSAIGTAQSGTEFWRPNISEDNKTATWEQTSDFIVDTMKFHSNDIRTIAKGSRNCSIAFQYSEDAASGSMRTVFFDRVDALSIRVQVAPGLTESTVSFAGTNNVPYGVKSIKTGGSESFVSIVEPVQLRFEDQEMAKRVARALMHAALLCGGNKAVSPF